LESKNVIINTIKGLIIKQKIAPSNLKIMIIGNEITTFKILEKIFILTTFWYSCNPFKYFIVNRLKELIGMKKANVLIREVYVLLFEIKNDICFAAKKIIISKIILDIIAINKDADIICVRETADFSEAMYFVIPFSIPAMESDINEDKVFFRLLNDAKPEGPI